MGERLDGECELGGPSRRKGLCFRRPGDKGERLDGECELGGQVSAERALVF